MTGAEDATPVLRRARLLALDVDGTLTAGRVVYLEGQEQVSFSVLDGQGLAWVRDAGVAIAWITGRGCEATKRRAAELGVQELVLQSGPKDEALRHVQERLGIGVEDTIAMGDDLPDLGLAKRAALFCAPASAREEVRARAGLVTEAPGGEGAVRELCEELLRARGAWDEILARYGEAGP